MSNYLSEMLLLQLNEFLASRTGIYFPKERIRDLQRGITLSAQDFGYDNLKEFIDWLMSTTLTKDKITILANRLTIGETYFFRGKETFEIMEKKILPDLIRARKHREQKIKIWSAGTSTGEESYSLAILINKLIKDMSNWEITILATDINPSFLKKATDGLYSEWSFRNMPLWVKEEFFTKQDKELYKIHPGIKNMVNFFYLNLAENAYPSIINDIHDFDIIFCRNVLMYLSPDMKKQVIERLYLSLKEEGWLAVSPAEAFYGYFSQFKVVNFPGALFYQKKKRNILPEGQNFKKTAVKNVDYNQVKPWYSSYNTDNKKHIETKGKNNELAKILYDKLLSLYKSGHYREITGNYYDILLSKEIEQSDLYLSSRLMAMMARAFANLGELNEALIWCQKAISINKLNPDFYYLLATILQEQGNIEEAITALNRAIYVDYDFVLAHFAMGNLKRLLGNDKESDKYFNNTLELLHNYEKEDILQEAEGITAGRLADIIISVIEGKIE